MRRKSETDTSDTRVIKIFLRFLLTAYTAAAPLAVHMLPTPTQADTPAAPQVATLALPQKEPYIASQVAPRAAYSAVSYNIAEFMTIDVAFFLQEPAASKDAGAFAGGMSSASDFAGSLRSRGLPALIVIGLISMLPIFELRGGIPVGLALFKLNLLSTFAVSVLFNLIPVLPLLFFLNPIKAFFISKGILKGFFQFLERKAAKNRKLVERYEELGLALFVAVPLPATGAWTGAIIAVIMGLRPLKSFMFIAFGVLSAGVIVSLITLLGLKGLS